MKHMVYISMLCLLMLTTMAFLWELLPGAGELVHVHGHACIVWQHFVSQSISCDWGKP